MLNLKKAALTFLILGVATVPGFAKEPKQESEFPRENQGDSADCGDSHKTEYHNDSLKDECGS